MELKELRGWSMIWVISVDIKVPKIMTVARAIVIIVVIIFIVILVDIHIHSYVFTYAYRGTCLLKRSVDIRINVTF